MSSLTRKILQQFLSNVQLLHSSTQSFLPTKAQLGSLCILQVVNPFCDASPYPLPSCCPWEHPPAQTTLLLSTVWLSASSVASTGCSDPLHGCTTPVKGGGGELLLAVKMARKSLRGSKTKIALSTMNKSKLIPMETVCGKLTTISPT